jgi:hypothetical protein
MENKIKYRIIKNCFVGSVGDIVIVDWDSYDGASWENISKNIAGNPFTELDCVVEIKEDDILVDLCLSPYVGMSCVYCGRKYNSLSLLKESNPVCAEKDENGIKLACKVCFEENNEVQK